LEGMTWPSSPCGQVFHCDPPLFHRDNPQWSVLVTTIVASPHSTCGLRLGETRWLPLLHECPLSESYVLGMGILYVLGTSTYWLLLLHQTCFFMEWDFGLQGKVGSTYTACMS
jgi:hypothetical protein